MTIASSVRFAGAEVLRFLHQLNKQVGYDESAYGEEMQSTVGTSRGPRQFIIGFIPPDVEVNFVPIAQNVGKFLGSADSKQPPKNEKPPGSAATKKGVVKAWGSGVEERSPQFWADFSAMCSRLNCKPEDMVAAIMMESGFDPNAATGQAKGLNQIIKSVALGNKPLMTPQQWEEYGKMTGEQQLPFVEAYFKRFGKSGWANATQLYGANIGGNAVSNYKNPDAVIYNGHRDLRGPGGVRPKKSDQNTWPASGWPGDAIVQEMANYDGNANINKAYGLDTTGKGTITISDIEAKMNGQKQTKQFRLAMERIAQYGGGGAAAVEEKPVEFAKINGPGGVENGIIMGGSDITDQEEDDPMKQIGRHISVDAGRQQNFVKKQVDELKDQIAIARATPPIAMLVNPRSFTRHHEHQVDYAKGRRRPIVSMWHEKPIVISGKGTTAGQYVMKASGEGGLNATSRVQSVSYENLMSLVYFYKNNGMLHTSGLGDDMNRGVALIAMSIYIYYDGTMYIGSFDNFSVTDSAEKPHTLEYNFGFTCRYEVKVTSVSDASLAGVTGATL